VAVLEFDEDESDLAGIAGLMSGARAPAGAFALTFNFYPPLAPLTDSLGIPYAAWVIDCTLNVFVHDPRFSRPNVCLFVFDERDIDRYARANFSRVFLMPQSSNVERMKPLDLTEQERRECGAGVSFVGDALVTECNEYLNRFLPEATRRIAADPDPVARRVFRITRMACEETLDWFDENPFALIDDIARRLREKESDYRTRLAQLGVADFDHLAILVAKESARRQRHRFIGSLSDIGVDVWGGPDWEPVMSGRNRYRGRAEHMTVLPRIYNGSKINLNITRPYSDRGLPMRVFDVMACGGFLLSNHPHSLRKWFRPGKDVETYDSLTELREKIRYYLDHEHDRRDIAENGLRAVRASHTHAHRLNFIFSKLFPETRI